MKIISYLTSLLFVINISIAYQNQDGINIITVPKGCHYPGCLPHAPIYNKESEQNVKVAFTRSNIEYADVPGFDCATCWNKLFGKTRCNQTIHQDSDRFVWRAAENRLQVQLAAYAYENGVNPYNPPNPDLLKVFNTLIDIEKFYRFQIIFQEQKTIFNLYDDDNGKLLETISIDHRLCDSYNKGFDSGFYFGGHSVAPISVSSYYEILQNQMQNQIQ